MNAMYAMEIILPVQTVVVSQTVTALLVMENVAPVKKVSLMVIVIVMVM